MFNNKHTDINKFFNKLLQKTKNNNENIPKDDKTKKKISLIQQIFKNDNDISIVLKFNLILNWGSRPWDNNNILKDIKINENGNANSVLLIKSTISNKNKGMKYVYLYVDFTIITFVRL